MPINSKDLVDLAHKMVQGEVSEVVARSVISRAYYGAYHAAKLAVDFKDTSPQCHSKLIQYYQQKNLAVYNKLGGLFKKRKDADYELNKNFSKREAGACCTSARDVLMLVDEMSKGKKK